MITLPKFTLHKLNAHGVSHIVAPLAVVAVLAIGATFVSVANKSTDVALVNGTTAKANDTTAKEKRGYLVIFGKQSDTTRFSYANIKMTGTEVPHKCGKTLNGSNSVTKRLPRATGKTNTYAPLKMPCAAVGGSAEYVITYAKNKKLQGATSVVTADVDGGTCTFVYPDQNKIRKVALTGGNCASEKETVAATPVEIRVRPELAKNNRSFKGYVEFVAAESLEKRQCAGVAVIETTTGGKTTSYKSSLRYTKPTTANSKGYCVIKLRKTQVATGDTTVKAVFAGTPALAAANGEATLTVPKSSN